LRCHLCSSCDRRLSRTLRGPSDWVPPARSRTAAGAVLAGGLRAGCESRIGRAQRSAGPNPRDHSQPGIFDVVADLFSAPGPIAVAGLSTGQSGRRAPPSWRPPRRGTEASRSAAVVQDVHQFAAAAVGSGPRSIGASARASPWERAVAHSSPETERRSSPYLKQARAGLSHDTAGSLVVRYFDCVVLPHASCAALPRFRMKRPPGTKRGGPLEAQNESRRWGYSAAAH
jgi:hypothetical protein